MAINAPVASEPATAEPTTKEPIPAKTGANAGKAKTLPVKNKVANNNIMFLIFITKSICRIKIVKIRYWQNCCTYLFIYRCHFTTNTNMT